MTFTRDHKNHKEYAFWKHQYARVKNVFESKENAHDFCADSSIFMFLVNRKFLEQFALKTKVNKMKSKLEVKNIDSKIHGISSYCQLDLYFREQFKNNLKIAHIKDEFHLVENFNANVLIDINIMKSKKYIFDFKIKNMIFSSCEDIKILIDIFRIDQLVNRSILVAKKIIVSFYINMTILVKVREKSLLEKDYIFNLKENFMLKSKKEFFNHIMINKLIAIQIKNTSFFTKIIIRN